MIESERYSQTLLEHFELHYIIWLGALFILPIEWSKALSFSLSLFLCIGKRSTDDSPSLRRQLVLCVWLKGVTRLISCKQSEGVAEVERGVEGDVQSVAETWGKERWSEKWGEEAVPSGCQPLSTQQQVWEIWKALLLMLSGSGLCWDEDEAEEAWGDALLWQDQWSEKSGAQTPKSCRHANSLSLTQPHCWQLVHWSLSFSFPLSLSLSLLAILRQASTSIFNVCQIVQKNVHSSCYIEAHSPL